MRHASGIRVHRVKYGRVKIRKIYGLRGKILKVYPPPVSSRSWVILAISYPLTMAILNPSKGALSPNPSNGPSKLQRNPNNLRVHRERSPKTKFAKYSSGQKIMVYFLGGLTENPKKTKTPKMGGKTHLQFLHNPGFVENPSTWSTKWSEVHSSPNHFKAQSITLQFLGPK